MYVLRSPILETNTSSAEVTKGMDDVTPTGSSPQDQAVSPPAPTPPKTRKWLLGVLTLIFLLCGAAYGTYWAFIGRYEESTDDAYVAGNTVPFTTRVNGTVIAIRADNTQRVQEGQALVLLDSTDARIIHDDTVTVLPAEVKGSSPATGTIPDLGQRRITGMARPETNGASSRYERGSVPGTN
jgi:hypothetical protein